MAFGIDDFLGAAAGAVNLADTLVRTVQRNKAKPGEVGHLIAEVRIEAVKRIDEAHEGLNQFERLLAEKGDLRASLQTVIERTPFWNPVEAFQLWRAKRSLDAMANSLFKSSEDVNALVRCMRDTADTGTAVVEAARGKHEFNKRFLEAKSVGEKIQLLRGQLDGFRAALAN